MDICYHYPMKRYIQNAVAAALKELLDKGEITEIPNVEISVPKENFGDFSVNAGHAIARSSGAGADSAKLNPVQAGELVAKHLTAIDAASEKNFAEIKVVNGFVNIFIAPEKLGASVLQMQKEIQIEQLGVDDNGRAKKVVFEYSSPNTNKPLHIGHTRNDVYGAACINLLRAIGYDVTSTEIINDRGIHIMKSMLMYMKFGAPETPASAGTKPDHFVGKFYQMFAAESAKSEGEKEQLEAEAQELLLKWESGDSEVRALWETMNEWFYEGVKETYAREGSTFDEVEHESEIYNEGRDLVLAGVETGVFQKEDDGSVSVDLTPQGLDKKYLLRKDGTTIYITQDMYLWYLRNEKHHPDLALVTTSSEQAYHFNVLKHLFILLAFPWAQKFNHLPYEHVFLGKSKMSSREGNTITADDLVLNVKEKVRETMSTSQKIKSSSEDEELVEAIAFAAIKYGYLKYDRNTKIYFDLDETIAIEGNTGPYLQYTYARINSVLEKAEAGAAEALNLLKEPSEQTLMRALVHYPDAVVVAAREYRPSLLCANLFDLAQKFNTFYDQVSVMNAENEELKNQRAALLRSVAVVLEHGLRLLGIKAVQKI